MTYEYRCPEHGTFEREEPIAAEHRADCPECGAPAQRIYHPVGMYYGHPAPLFHEDGSYEEK